MFHYFSVVMQQYAVFRGRARRAEYWYFSLACLLLGMVLGFVFTFLGLLAGFKEQTVENGLDVATLILHLALFVPTIAVGVRRLHDSNKSGWWLLVPFYNLYLLIRRGTEGENFYGPDPKAPPVPVPTPGGVVGAVPPNAN